MEKNEVPGAFLRFHSRVRDPTVVIIVGKEEEGEEEEEEEEEVAKYE